MTNSQRKSEDRQFLEAIALQLNLTGDTLETFLRRFDQENATKDNSTLVNFITWNRQPEDGAQKLQDELARVCEILEKAGCPTGQKKRGRAPRGQSPWEQAYKWLWESRYPEWQQQNQRPISEQGETGRNSQADIDALVQEVRSRLTPKIKNVVGTLRMLRVSDSVPVDEIYVDLNVLQQVSRDRTFSDYREAYRPGDRRSFPRVGLEQVEQDRVSVLTVVQNCPRLMVLGKPGSGKTTLLKSLTVQCIKEEEPLQWNQQLYVPIFVTLRRFAEAVRKEERLSLLDYIVRQEFGSWGNRSRSVAEAIVHQGRALILLDGLDEVPAAEQSSVVMEIEQFCQFANRVLITCRTQWRQRLEGFTDVEVANFTRVEVENSQVVQFIHSWFRKVVGGEQSADLAEKLIQQIRDNEPIAELTETPVLLNLICSVCRDGKGILPRNRADLYRKGIRDLLTNIDAEKPGLERAPIDAALTPDKKEELLIYLAVTLFGANDLFPEQSILEKLVAEYLHIERWQAETILRSLEEQSGLLIERAEGFWSFSHLTFQEYFVARHIGQTNDLGVLLQHITDMRWREVFLLAVDEVDEPDLLLLKMKSRIDDLPRNDAQFQWFLQWVSKRSLAASLFCSYKIAAIRAHYCLIPNMGGLEGGITSLLDPVENLHKPDNILLFINLILDKSLCAALKPSTSINQSEIEWCRDSINTAETLSAESLFDYLNTSNNFWRELREIKEQLPNISGNNDLSKAWWTSDGQSWQKRLRILAVEYRNISDLYISRSPTFMDYLMANKLLIECLNSSRRASLEVRREIEEELLLPIAELRKLDDNGRSPQ